MYFYHPHTGRFEQSTRSFLRPGFAITTKSLDDDVLYTPYRVYRTHGYGGYDTTGEENYTRSAVNRELMSSTAAMEDSFDISARSRNRDREVLAAASRAITPPPVLSASALESSPASLGVSESGWRQNAQRRSNSTPRSLSVPPKRPSYNTNTTTTIVPLDLSASPAPPTTSPMLGYAKTLESIRALRDNTYEPMYSQTVRTPYSPVRDLSPFSYRSDSPFHSPPRSGTQTPVGAMTPVYNRSSRKRHKVLSTKRRTGNYYNRLLSKRAADSSGKQGKYWPYIDVEDIGKEDIHDLLSDTESMHGDYAPTYYVTSRSGADDDYTPMTYDATHDYDSDIPEYVPFRPKIRGVSPERDYSNISVVPYLPKRDPNKNSIADDIAFNAIVAASAARARRALESVNWQEYDDARLVLSVEGEYQPKKDETPLAFRYISRPLALKTPATRSVSAFDSDDSFTRYMNDLQKFREGIRKRLEDGYKALTQETNRYYTPALITSSCTSRYQLSKMSDIPSIQPYRKRLDSSSGYRYGHSLELYPLSSSTARGSSYRSLPASDDMPESRALKLYDSKYDPTLSKLPIVAKVQIKAALLGSKVDIVRPNRRPRSAYAKAHVKKVEQRKEQAASEAPVSAPEETVEHRMYKPVSKHPQLLKPIRCVDGIKSPNPNIMSWKHRIDAYTSPDDIVMVPRSLNSVRASVLEVQDKLDRHKQLMDRYLVTDTGLSADDRRVLEASKAYLATRA